MKLTLTMKTPDALISILSDELRHLEDEEEKQEKEALIRNTVEPYLEYGEYLTVEFDTELKTATVLKVK